MDGQIGVDVYLHVSNGGVTFRVMDHPEWGPCIEVDQGQFAAVDTKLTIKTTPDSLRALAELLTLAADHDWSPAAVRSELGGEPWQDIPRAKILHPKLFSTSDSVGSRVAMEFMPDWRDPARTWHYIGGDLEASYDGARYIDIRKFDGERLLFISLGTLQNAMGLFHPAPIHLACRRVASRWMRSQISQSVSRP